MKKYVLNGKVVIILLTVDLMKKILLYKLNYFPRPYTSKNKIKVELDFSNYWKKLWFKNLKDVDASDFDKKADWGNLKTTIIELDVEKLKNVPGGINRLKSKWDKLDAKKLVPLPAGFKKISDAFDK